MTTVPRPGWLTGPTLGPYVMRLLDLSFATPEDNLALDEALLHQLQAVETSGERPVETLRFWESATPFVVLGRSLRLAEEVDVEAAARAGVLVLRRVSGGGTVVIGPGSLNFTIVLSLNCHPEHRDIRRSMQAIVTTIATALPIDGLHLAGTSDLLWHDWKVSGHAQRRSRDGLLHHGTLLYGLDLPLMARVLKEPPRQPDHRAKRIAPRLHAQPAARRHHHERGPGARVERHAGRRQRSGASADRSPRASEVREPALERRGIGRLRRTLMPETAHGASRDAKRRAWGWERYLDLA